MSTHHRGDRADWLARQAERVAIMEARVAAGLSPTTGLPANDHEEAEQRSAERRSRAQRKRA